MDQDKIEQLKFFLNFFEKIEVEPTLKRSKERLNEQLLGMETRSEMFIKEFNEQFPINSFDRNNALCSLRNNLYDVVNLYLLNQKSPLIIELHSNLETLSIFYYSGILVKDDKEKREVIRKELTKKSLPYFSAEWHKRGIWNDDDISFVKHLNKLRNGIAHKNLENIQATLGIAEFRGQMLSKYFIEEDVLPLIISTIKVENKLIFGEDKPAFRAEDVIERAKTKYNIK